MEYSIFRYDSRNTGYHCRQGLESIAHARSIAIALSKTGFPAQVEGENNYFEKYENGEKTEWSA